MSEAPVESPPAPIGTDRARPGPLYVLTAAEMQSIDRRAMTEHAIASDQLMENAGTGTVHAMEARYGDLHGYRVGVVCGKGHNGGDGLVVARRLRERGVEVEVGLLGKVSELEGVVATNASRVSRTGVEVRELSDASGLESWLGDGSWDYVVDAMLGTGSRGELRGLFADAAHAITLAAAAGAQIIAVDLPTGLETDTGQLGEPYVGADLTVTYAYPKRGHVLYPGRSACGAIEIIDIGIPDEAAEAEGCRLELGTADALAPLVPDRSPTAHKGTAGRGLIVGGSTGLTGAVTMTAGGALSSGIGMVFAAVPASLNPIFEVKLTECVTYPMPETDGATLSREALPAIEQRLERAHAVAIGPGLGLGPDADEVVGRLIANAKRPLVIDADALTVLSRGTTWPDRLGSPAVITPHVGEMSRLTGLDAEVVERRRIEVAIESAARWKVTVLLKGAPTIVASPDGRATVNASGNPGMASLGMGDVLTGCILALLAKGLSPYDAARLGAYVHGRASDRIVERRRYAVSLATEVAGALPMIFGELSQRAGRRPAPPPLPEGRDRTWVEPPGD